MPFMIILPEEELPKNETELSYQFVLRPASIDVEITSLYNEELWLLVQSLGHIYIWCKLYIIRIENVKEGGYISGYILSGDINSSEYFCRIGEKNGTLKLDDISKISKPEINKLIKIRDDDSKIFAELIQNSIPIKIIPPYPSFFKDLTLNSFEAPLKVQLSALVQQLKSKYVVKELYKHPHFPSEWSPYEHFAFYFLNKNNPQNSKALKSIISSVYVKKPDTITLRSTRVVDLRFRKVLPDEVSKRSFIAPKKSSRPNIYEILLKTDEAESMHQRILADLASRIIYLGFTPTETNSIDLYAEGKDGSVIFEIKSSNKNNFIQQCFKGTIQLKEYRYNLMLCQNSLPKEVLVIQKHNNLEREAYCKEFLKFMGTEMLIYDSTLNWPCRLVGFDDLVKSISQ